MASQVRLQNLDPVEDLMARLRLDKAARQRGVAITEGPTDNRILSATLGVSEKDLFPAGGQRNVLRCARKLKDEPLTGVICVADRDFNCGEAAIPDMWWLVFYDDADVEAMIVESPALTRVLEEWSSESKLARFGGVEAVRAAVRESAGPLAILRAVNARDGLGLSFDGINLQDLFDKSTGELRVASLIGKLAEQSEVSHEELKKSLETERPVCPHTNRPLARGRDLIAAIGALLRKLVGSLGKQQAEGAFVEKSLRLALRNGDFDQTPFRDRFIAAMRRATAS
jgi:hypothetical protein